MISTVYLSEGYRAGNPNREVADIPIIFVYARNAEGAFGYNHISDEATLQQWVEGAIQIANDLYSDEFNLFQLGDIIYLDHDEIHNITGYLIGFTYVANAIVVSIVPAKAGSSPFGTLSFHNITSGSENFPDNMVLMGPAFLHEDLQPDWLAHGIGHVFNLLHTFQPFSYYDPVLNQNVYDTDLVIREQDNNKPVPDPNWDYRGDLVKDTDADCLRNHPAWTNCLWTSAFCAINNSNNKFKYDGSFVDLNGDDLINHGLRERNIMSYYLCRDLVTNGQLDRVAQLLSSYRRDQLNASAYDLVDYIEFEGTTKKMKNILAIFNFPSIGNYSNTRTATHRYTTNSSGKIETVLLDDVIKANVMFGSKRVEVNNMGFSVTYLPSVNSDWKDSLNILDVVAIQRFIGYPGPQFSQNTLPDGYKKLAADVNDDGFINSADFILIQDLILGKLNTFSSFTQPWRFVPEFILQGAFGFHVNPFDRTINNNFIPKADYTKPDFSFEITDGFNGKSGFDGIKIGNAAYTPDLIQHPGLAFANNTSSISLAADSAYHITLSVESASFNAIQLKLVHQNGFIDEESFSCNLAIDSFSMDNIHYTSDDSIISILWSLPGLTLDSIYFISFKFVPYISSSDMNDYFYLDNDQFASLIIDTAGNVTSGTVSLMIESSVESELRSISLLRVGESISLVKLSPNPVFDQLLVQVEFSDELFLKKSFTFDVIDIKGVTLIQTENNFVSQNSKLSLPVHGLTSGLYYLRINMEAQSVVLPFVKQ